MLKDLHIEYRPFRLDDFSECPSCFQDEFPSEITRLFRHDICGMINLGDRHLYYFHNLDKHQSRWSGIIELSKQPLGLQNKIAGVRIAYDDALTPYGEVTAGPLQYGVSTTSGIPMDFIFDEKGCSIKENDVLDVHGEWFPFGLVCHVGSEYDIPFMHLPVHLKGSFLGEDVEFLACIDRVFGPANREKEILVNMTRYISSYCSGIRKDGRREWFIALQCHENGKGLGIYWLEGEEPIISDEVINEGIWQKVPYVDDDTAVCVDNIWRFAGKTFHVLGKWGAKGFTETPRFDRHGQSQMFGTWYEGDIPYEHRVWNTFSENMEAYCSDMKRRGYRVKE